MKPGSEINFSADFIRYTLTLEKYHKKLSNSHGVAATAEEHEKYMDALDTLNYETESLKAKLLTYVGQLEGELAAWKDTNK